MDTASAAIQIDSCARLAPFTDPVRLIRVARYHAIREGVHPSDIEDCEVTFTEQMLWRLRSSDILAGVTHKSAWLHQCARNHVRSFQRQRLRNPAMSLTAAVERREHRSQLIDRRTPETEALRKQAIQDLGRAVDMLRPAHRTLVVYFYGMGYTAPEIARISGKSTRAIEQSLYRARAFLRDELRRAGYCAADWTPTA
jgi:RNA polymerase sigma factor (sigma-70 family)